MGAPLPSRLFSKHLWLVVLLTGISCSGSICATDGYAQLSWEPPAADESGSEVVGYRIHIGNEPGRYDRAVDVGNAHSHLITGLEGGRRYYFSVTSYDSSGAESALAAEVHKDIP